MRHAIEDAISAAGSEGKLAKLAGVSQPAINKAKQAGRVSASLALKIEIGLNGSISKERLCPEIFAPSRAPAREEGAQ